MKIISLIVLLFLTISSMKAQPVYQELLKTAEERMKNKQWDAAIEAYNLFLQNPNNKDLSYNIDLALCYAEKATIYRKNNPNFNLIGVQNVSNDAMEALKYFRKYLYSQPPLSTTSDINVFDTYTYIADIYASENNWEQCIEYLEKLYKVSPNHKLQDNVTTIDKVLKGGYSGYASWCINQGVLYDKSNNKIESKKFYEKGLSLFKEPLTVMNYLNRGFAYYNIKNYEKANQDFNQVILLDKTGEFASQARQYLNSSQIENASKLETLTFERPSYKGEILYYKGQVKNGMANGEGEVTTSTNQYYKGDFKDNEYHGKGLHKWANGDTYEGDWVNGQRTGKGFYKWINGQYYDGDFVSGNISVGSGICYFYYDNGTYKGGMLNNLFNGKGTYRWKNGDIYEGDWKNGNRTGIGKYTFANGKIEEGIFENNVFKGTSNVTKPTEGFNEEKEVERAKLAVKERRYQDAIGNYTFLIQKTGQAFAFYERGKIYATLKDYQKAKDDFYAAINIWSTSQTEKYSWLKEDAQKELKKIENK